MGISDILAELDLPPSGITRFENIIPYPKQVNLELPAKVVDPAATQMILLYYSTQIVLRKILNLVHKELYREDKKLSECQSPLLSSGPA